MKKLFLFPFLFILLFCTSYSFAFSIPPAHKHVISAQAGSSLFIFNNMHPAQRLGLVTFRSEWDPVYTEIFAGGFGPSRNTYLSGVDIGLSFWGFGLSTGAAWLTRTSESLSTHWQLVQSLRYSIPSSPFFVSFTHYSNGHKVFRHRLIPNHGENFLSVGVQFDF
jgi:hypothetical protein